MRWPGTLMGAVILFLAACSYDSGQELRVGGVVDGKPLRLSPRLQRDLAEESVRLLKSCTYANLQPGGQYASVIAGAEEQSHLHLKFFKPRLVHLSVRKKEVPSGTVDLAVREMVITLPLSGGAVLVRSNTETAYFAKFNCSLAQELEKTLNTARPR